jgi:hypothetical protein
VAGNTTTGLTVAMGTNTSAGADSAMFDTVRSLRGYTLTPPEHPASASAEPNSEPSARSGCVTVKPQVRCRVYLEPLWAQASRTLVLHLPRRGRRFEAVVRIRRVWETLAQTLSRLRADDVAAPAIRWRRLPVPAATHRLR